MCFFGQNTSVPSSLVEHFPTKQGLRHQSQKSQTGQQRARRAFSNKTRIKTVLRLFLEAHFGCALVEHFPTKQGLRLQQELDSFYLIYQPRRAFSNKTRIKTSVPSRYRTKLFSPRRAFSNKTRIKTPLSHQGIELNCSPLVEHFPTKQGLRLESSLLYFRSTFKLVEHFPTKQGLRRKPPEK